MSQLPAIDYDFDNPCDWDEFLERVEKRMAVVEKIESERKSPNADAHPQPPQYAGSMWAWWSGRGTD